MEPITDYSDTPGMVILNRNPRSPPNEGSQHDTSTYSDDSFVISRPTQDIKKKLNSKVPAPKCKDGMVDEIKVLKKSVINCIDKLSSKINIPGSDPFVSLSSFLGSTMEDLYQLHSFIDGYSKPHTADANTFFEHSFPHDFKAFRAKLVSSPLEEAKKQIQDLQSKLEELN